MDNPPGSLPAQRRTTLVTFLFLLISVMVITALMVLPYVLAVTMGGTRVTFSAGLSVAQGASRHTESCRRRCRARGDPGAHCATLFFVTKAIQQGIAIGQGLAEGGVSLRSLLDHVSGWAPIETLIGSPEAFENQARRWMQSAGTGATATILGLAAHLPNIFLQLALASIACFFLLVDGHRFLCWMTDKIPIAADVQVKVVQSFKDTAISVIWATLAAAAAQCGDVAELSHPWRACRIFGS